VSDCAALNIERNSNGFRVTTSKGVVNAKKVVVATSGYTGTVTPWQRRRLVPIGSYMLATEKLDPARAEKLMPKKRVFSDSRKLVVYFRRSPDGNRVLFGGRVSVFESDPVKSAPALRQEMLRIFPQLEDVKLSHSWMGFVGFTFDYLPHLVILVIVSACRYWENPRVKLLSMTLSSRHDHFTPGYPGFCRL